MQRIEFVLMLMPIYQQALCMIYPSVFEGFGVPVLEAMKAHVPVLTSENTSMKEVATDAGLYFNPHNYEDIADKLMMIYKDESLRSSLIEKGKMVSDKFSWTQTANLLWQSIMEAAEAKSWIGNIIKRQTWIF